MTWPGALHEKDLLITVLGTEWRWARQKTQETAFRLWEAAEVQSHRLTRVAILIRAVSVGRGAWLASAVF